MAISKNYAIIRNHFRKDWQRRVKTHFDQPCKKVSRRAARAARAAKIAPRPLDLLRPIVRAPTVKYNRKVRAGRGFSLEEVKAAGLSAKYARTIGIAVDHRRQNRSVEGLEANVNRLKEYLAKLIVFPTNENKPKKGDANAADLKSTAQTLSVAGAFPITQTLEVVSERAISADEKTASAYKTLRNARSKAKYAGIRDKRAKDKAEAEAEKKK
uniref:60S ribosomal protein L13 n=1 Tax=Ictalurus punctatus TaxID=7998 RepID=W5UDP8_ICTPU